MRLLLNLSLHAPPASAGVAIAVACRLSLPLIASRLRPFRQPFRCLPNVIYQPTRLRAPRSTSFSPCSLPRKIVNSKVPSLRRLARTSIPYAGINLRLGMSDPTQPLPLPTAPELVFGLVAPIGVDLALVTEVLEQTLLEVGYIARQFRLTELMKEVPTSITLKETPYVKSYRTRIAYANEVRRKLGNEALAVLAISAIRSFRADERRTANSAASGDALEPSTDETDEEAPLPNQAYILRQLKSPEEIALLRSVYGKQFILVSAFSPTALREKRIEDLERRCRGGLISEVEARNLAHTLISQENCKRFA